MTGDTIMVPRVPTEDQWGGLARAIMMWLDMSSRTPRALFAHLECSGHEIPDWLRKEPEMQYLDHVPSKGTRCAIIYRAMLEAAPKQVGGKREAIVDPLGLRAALTEERAATAAYSRVLQDHLPGRRSDNAGPALQRMCDASAAVDTLITKADAILALSPQDTDLARMREALGQDVEQLGEALFAMSAQLKASGLLDDSAHRAVYERVVAAFQALSDPPATMEVEDDRPQCSVCRGRTWVSIDVRKADGSFTPSSTRRCVNCKTTFSAQAFAALSQDARQVTGEYAYVGPAIFELGLEAGDAALVVQHGVPIEPPEVWLPINHTWLRLDGERISGWRDGKYFAFRPGVLNRWKIRRAGRAWLRRRASK